MPDPIFWRTTMRYSKAQCDLIASLQCQVKALTRRIEELESDPGYARLIKEHEEQLAKLRADFEKKINTLSRELSKTRKELERVGHRWMDVVGDVEAEKDRELSIKEKEIASLKGKVEKKASEKRAVQEEAVSLREKIHDLEDEVKKLKGRLNMDFTNSSMPSSRTPFRAAVQNGREPTGKNPGAQPGHKGHRRPELQPTQPPIVIEAPADIRENGRWYIENDADGNPKMVKKTVVSARLVVDVIEYRAYIYRNRDTKETYHAPFPGNLPTVELEYDDSVKALAFLLNTHMNVSLKKTQEFLDYASEGHLRSGGKGLSTGWINGLSREFSIKTEKDRKNAFDALINASVLYYDFTNSLENGKYRQVLVVTDKERALYFAREHKGHNGLKDSPVELNHGIHVHDYDHTFLSYSDYHQLCLAHDYRHLKGAAEIAPEYTWITKMKDLVGRMMKARSESTDEKVSSEKKAEFKKEYDEILQLAEKEYDDTPPSVYARKGYNLFVKLRDQKEHELRFLEHPEVDFTNNVSERLARSFKGGLRSQGTFREGPKSEEHNRSMQYRCDSLSDLETTRMQGGNVWTRAREVFKRSSETPVTCQS